MLNSLEEWCGDAVLAEEVADVGQQEASVTVVGHMTTIVDAGYEVFECVPGCVLILIQVDVKKVL